MERQAWEIYTGFKAKRVAAERPRTVVAPWRGDLLGAKEWKLRGETNAPHSWGWGGLGNGCWTICPKRCETRSAHVTGNEWRRQNGGGETSRLEWADLFLLLAITKHERGISTETHGAHVSWSTRTRHACRRVNYMPELRAGRAVFRCRVTPSTRLADTALGRTRTNVVTRHSDGQSARHQWTGRSPDIAA